MTIKSSLQEHAQIFQWGTRKNTNVYSRMGIPYFWIPYQEYQSLSGISILMRNTSVYLKYQFVRTLIGKTHLYREYQSSSETLILSISYQECQSKSGILLPCNSYRKDLFLSGKPTLIWNTNSFKSVFGIPILI